MKLQLFSVLLLIIVLFVSVISCGDSKESITSSVPATVLTPTNQDDSNPSYEANGNESLLTIMQKVPNNISSFWIKDLNALNNDLDLQSYLESTQRNYFLDETIGVSYDKMDKLAYSPSDGIWVVTGDFILQDVGDHLSANGYIENEYNGIDVWSNTPISLIAVMDGIVMFGDIDIVHACIDIIESRSSSLYELPGALDLMTKLPQGFEVQLGVKNSSKPEGPELWGTVMSKTDSERFATTTILEFKDHEAAQNSVSDIESSFKDPRNAHMIDLQISCNEQYVSVIYLTYYKDEPQY